MPVNLLSIGYICSIVQKTPGIVERALRDCGASPVQSVDGVAYFDVADVNAAIDRINAESERAPAQRGPRR